MNTDNGVPSKKQPIISICIPTYNRCDKVVNLVKSILRYEGDEIEVVVLDNCSNDKTEFLLSLIDDLRFRFFRNNENIGGPMNQLKVLTLAKGVFAFFCLDKDFLDHESIKELIRCIEVDIDIVFGYCSLNLGTKYDNVVYDRGIQSLIKMAYLSQHPSGIFYKTEIYTKLPFLKEVLANAKPFPFYPDLMSAEMAMLGKAILINFPSFHTETREECKSVASFTYSANNAFFIPANRLKEFDIYINSVLRQKGLSKVELIKLFAILYNRCLTSSTFGYREIMADYEVCLHHGMETKKIRLSEMVATNIKFSRNFFNKNLPIGHMEKIFIYSICQLKFIIKLILE